MSDNVRTTLTFSNRFEDEGVGSDGPWTRWTYTTSDKSRYQTYNDELKDIPLKEPVEIVYGQNKNGKNTILSYEGTAGEPETKSNDQTSAKPAEKTEKDWDAINRSKTRALIAPAIFPVLWAELDEEARSAHAAKAIGDDLVEWVFGS